MTRAPSGLGPGQPPKRSDQRRRRNKPPIEYQRGRRATDVEIPKADPKWHPIAHEYYRAFQRSGQTEFFEPSDWAHLIDVLDDVSAYKRKANRSATMRAALDAALSRLMVAEGDRRRLRIELAGAEVEDTDETAAVTALSEHVQRFTG